MVLVHILVASCLLLVYGDATTTVTGVNVTTALPRTNLTDSWRDTLNSTTPSRIVQDPTPNVRVPTTTTTAMSLTAPIFMTPTPSPTTTTTSPSTTTPTSNTTEEDAYPTFYTSSPTVSWTSPPSTPSTPNPKDPTPFNPYPGYFLPTSNSTTSRPPPITLFPTTQNQSQNQNQNESRPLPTTTYIEMTPPPTPTPSIMSPSVTSPDISESYTMSVHDKTYFRLLFAIYLVVMTLLVIYIMKD